MAGALALIDLAGFVALLLWGVRMVQTGFERALGANLRHVLELALGNPLKAFAAGLGVTAVLQSSTATGLMVASFAGAGMIDLVPALAAMLGANVGTTLIVQVLSFDVMAVVPPLFLAGLVMFRRGGSRPVHDFGRVAIGLGLILLALDRIVAEVAPFEAAPAIKAAIETVARTPLLAVAAATVVTWAAHSSVAVVLLVGSFAASGVVPVEGALAFVLGANLGTAVNPVLESSGDPAARRVPIGNLATRVVGCLVMLPLLPLVAPLFAAMEADAARRVADFHTAFNLVLALAFLPVLGPSARLLERLLPERPVPPDPARPRFLDPSVLSEPALAIDAARREAARLTELVAEMLAEMPAAFSGDAAAQAEIKRRDKIVDGLVAAIRDYLGMLSDEEFAPADRRRLIAVLLFATNHEHAAETIDHAIVGHVRKHAGQQAALAGDAAIGALTARLVDAVGLAGAVFAGEDGDAAAALDALEARFAADADASAAAHVAALRAGQAATAEATAVALDVLRDLKLVAGFLADAVADPLAAEPAEAEA